MRKEEALSTGKHLFLLNKNDEAERVLKQVSEPEPERLAALAFRTALYSMNGEPDKLKEVLGELSDASLGPNLLQTELVKCPESRYIFLREYSGRDDINYTGPIWSDGYVSGLESQTAPLIIKCPICGMMHPVTELVIVSPVPNKMYSDELRRIEWIEDHAEEFYQEALEQDWGEDFEIQLRFRLLWKQNHIHRQEPPDVETYFRDHYKNIERLVELDSMKDDPIRLAELYRELGNFSKCRSVLDAIRTEPQQNFIPDGIRKAADMGITAPVWLQKKLPPPPEIEKEIPFENRHEYGFDPLPAAEDIFAFPERGREEEYKPVLSVKLSLIDPCWDGWGSFLYKDDQFYFCYDRLFSEFDWYWFQKYSPGWQEDLIWFWSHKSWNLPEDEYELDEYYRILYQLYYKRIFDEYLYTDYDSFLAIDLEIVKWEFNDIWEQIENDLVLLGKEYEDWLGNRRSRIYWDFLWQSHSEDFKVPGKAELKEFYKTDRNHTDDIDAKRRNAMSGLKYVEIGGKPSWFQENNKTPGMAGFVGQIWSDYMNIGSKLLYLFYDEASGMMIEKYDWD